MTVTVTNSTEKTVKKIKVLGRTFCSKLDGRAFQVPSGQVSWGLSSGLSGPPGSLELPVCLCCQGSRTLEAEVPLVSSL